MLGRASPLISLTVSYIAGFYSSPVVAGTQGPGPIGAAVALCLAACAAAAAWGAGRTRLAVRVPPLRIALVLGCFFSCGLARGIESERLWYNTIAGLKVLVSRGGEGKAAEVPRDGGPVDGPAGAHRAAPGEARGTGSAEAIVTGVVTGFPSELRGGTRFALRARTARSESVAVRWNRHGPRLLVTVRPAAEVRYGDLLRITGRIALPTGPRNPGGFDYGGYLRSKGVHATFKARSTEVRLFREGQGPALLVRAVGPVRRGIGGLVDRAVDGEAKALLRGLLLGDRSLMDRDVREAMARAGVVHIMAVSGLHVGLVALIVAVLARFAGASGRGAERISLAGVCGYCAIVGFPASACRASAMLAAYVFARGLQRPGAPFDSLAVAAFALSLLQPGWVATPGFQLSFAAAAGVLAFRNCLIRTVECLGKVRVTRFKGALTFLGVSVGASVTTWPIVAYHFGRAPLLFLLGNAFAVPLVGVVLAWAMAGVVLGPVSTTLSDCMFAAAWAAARLLLEGCERIGSISWASAEPAPFNASLIAGYLVALLATVAARGRARRAAAAMLCATAALICAGPERGPDGDHLEAAFLDVGHGDACVFVTPGGRTMLVDAGASGPSWDAGREVIVPYLRARRIRALDRVVISHGDGDHWGGLRELSKRVRVRELVLPENTPLGGLSDLLPELEARGASLRRVSAGDTLDPLGGLECVVLHPSAEFEARWAEAMGERLNDRSLVLRVRYGEVVFLMTGDVEGSAENWLAENGAALDCDVLKVPHHGSDTSSGVELIGAASPLVAVISCGPIERFNLPKPSVIGRYESMAAAVMTTSRDGAVIVRTDGVNVHARSFLCAQRRLEFRAGSPE